MNTRNPSINQCRMMRSKQSSPVKFFGCMLEKVNSSIFRGAKSQGRVLLPVIFQTSHSTIAVSIMLISARRISVTAHLKTAISSTATSHTSKPRARILPVRIFVNPQCDEAVDLDDCRENETEWEAELDSSYLESQVL